MTSVACMGDFLRGAGDANEVAFGHSRTCSLKFGVPKGRKFEPTFRNP
jgi:hypothetical protein